MIKETTHAWGNFLQVADLGKGIGVTVQTVTPAKPYPVHVLAMIHIAIPYPHLCVVSKWITRWKGFKCQNTLL